MIHHGRRRSTTTCSSRISSSLSKTFQGAFQTWGEFREHGHWIFDKSSSQWKCHVLLLSPQFLFACFPGISVCLETNCVQRCRWITMMQIMTATGDKLTVCYCNCNIFRIICCKSSLITRWTFFSDRETVVDTLTNLKFLDGRPTFAVNHVKKSLSSSSNDITQNHSQSQRNSRKTKMQRIESFKQFFRITPRNRVADNSQ